MRVSEPPLEGEEFGKVLLEGCADVADVVARACEKFEWGVPTRARLFLVTAAAKVPTPAELEVALLGEPLSAISELADAGVVSGCRLLARVPPPAAAAPGASTLLRACERACPPGLPRPPPPFPLTLHPHPSNTAATTAPPADFGLLVESIRDLKVLLSAVVEKVVTLDYRFSAASPSAVRGLITARGFDERSVPLPVFGRHLMPAGLEPFTWGQRVSETSAAPVLQQLLERWVKRDFTPVLDNAFVDVQRLAKHSPLAIHEAAVGNFTGVPDCAILCHGASAEVISPFSNCAFAVDWKRPTAFQGVRYQATLLALGLFELTDRSIPVFFTDLATRVLCFHIVGSTICCYTGADGTEQLSLEEGVGLMRFFLERDNEREAASLAATVALCAGGVVEAGDAVAHAGGAPRAAERAANVGGGGGGGASEACAPLDGAEYPAAFDGAENSAPQDSMGRSSAADCVAELRGITLAISHRLAARGGINCPPPPPPRLIGAA